MNAKSASYSRGSILHVFDRSKEPFSLNSELAPIGLETPPVVPESCKNPLYVMRLIAVVTDTEKFEGSGAKELFSSFHASGGAYAVSGPLAPDGNMLIASLYDLITNTDGPDSSPHLQMSTTCNGAETRSVGSMIAASRLFSVSFATELLTLVASLSDSISCPVLHADILASISFSMTFEKPTDRPYFDLMFVAVNGAYSRASTLRIPDRTTCGKTSDSFVTNVSWVSTAGNVVLKGISLSNDTPGALIAPVLLASKDPTIYVETPSQSPSLFAPSLLSFSNAAYPCTGYMHYVRATTANHWLALWSSGRVTRLNAVAPGYIYLHNPERPPSETPLRTFSPFTTLPISVLKIQGADVFVADLDREPLPVLLSAAPAGTGTGPATSQLRLVPDDVFALASGKAQSLESLALLPTRRRKWSTLFCRLPRPLFLIFIAILSVMPVCSAVLILKCKPIGSWVPRIVAITIIFQELVTRILLIRSVGTMPQPGLSTTDFAFMAIACPSVVRLWMHTQLQQSKYMLRLPIALWSLQGVGATVAASFEVLQADEGTNRPVAKSVAVVGGALFFTNTIFTNTAARELLGQPATLESLPKCLATHSILRVFGVAAALVFTPMQSVQAAFLLINICYVIACGAYLTSVAYSAVLPQYPQPPEPGPRRNAWAISALLAACSGPYAPQGLINLAVGPDETDLVQLRTTRGLAQVPSALWPTLIAQSLSSWGPVVTLHSNGLDHFKHVSGMTATVWSRNNFPTDMPIPTCSEELAKRLSDPGTSTHPVFVDIGVQHLRCPVWAWHPDSHS